MTDSSHEGIDPDELRADLQPVLGSPEGPVSLERHRGGGASNETHWLTWGDRDYVLRAGPADRGEKDFDYGSLHNIEREYRLLETLHGTAVPVPPPLGYWEGSGTPFDRPFYVMERLEGTIIDGLRNEEPEAFADPSTRRSIGESYLGGLVDLHGVDLDGRDGLVETLPTLDAGDVVRRCRRHLERVRTITGEERPVPHGDEIGDWLEDNVPDPEDITLVHGDYKPDNLMLAPSPPSELVGVLDWEMSSLGDPLLDLGWFLSFWTGPGDPEPDLEAPELFQDTAFTNAEGYPRRRQLVDLYEEKTGRNYEHDRFYRALAVFRLAVILEGFFASYLAGSADHPLYPMFEALVPHLTRRAKGIIEGREPLE